MRLVAILFAVLLVLALGLSILARNPVLYTGIAVNFVIWTFLGFVLAALSFAKAVSEWSGNTETRHEIPRDKDPIEQAPAGDVLKTAPEE